MTPKHKKVKAWAAIRNNKILDTGDGFKTLHISSSKKLAGSCIPYEAEIIEVEISYSLPITKKRTINK